MSTSLGINERKLALGKGPRNFFTEICLIKIIVFVFLSGLTSDETRLNGVKQFMRKWPVAISQLEYSYKKNDVKTKSESESSAFVH